VHRKSEEEIDASHQALRSFVPKQRSSGTHRTGSGAPRDAARPQRGSFGRRLMALPSSITLGSVALVVAAGVGLVAIVSNGGDDPSPHKPIATHHEASAEPDTQLTLNPHKPSTSPAHHKPNKHLAATPKVFVEVYNNSGITGLAADTAQALDQAGWNVTATDNWYGNIPDNTVYYPDELRPQARQLAKTLDITRLRPAVSPMQFDRLTVILTSG
jgi:hypothetical protein